MVPEMSKPNVTKRGGIGTVFRLDVLGYAHWAALINQLPLCLSRTRGVFLQNFLTN